MKWGTGVQVSNVGSKWFRLKNSPTITLMAIGRAFNCATQNVPIQKYPLYIKYPKIAIFFFQKFGV